MADPVHMIYTIEELYGHGSDDGGRSEVMGTDCLDIQESLGVFSFFFCIFYLRDDPEILISFIV